MTGIESLKLEIMRPGPLYGQLLSRLTDYIALCDGVQADTFRVAFDHYELRADLDSLRYYVGAGGAEKIPNDLRAAAVERLSRRVETVLAQMVGFQTRVAEASSQADLSHLRLVLGGGELSLIPFELSSTPPGWRGAGNQLSLRSRMPTVITRELRDSCGLPMQWNRRPRILVCAASPDGFAPVPLKGHLLAIARAVRPWVDGGTERGKSLGIEDVVTVLENASLGAIEKATNDNEFTHVHFLCHGCALPNHGGRTGMALCKAYSPAEADAVDAATLASVLWCRRQDKCPPTLAVLATCDSANQNAVEVPGASFACELHQAGVPWVIAAQMPLTYGGSAVFAERFYRDLFQGIDPRYVLHRVRHVLAADQQTHDWAALVAYASIPPDFAVQVRAFRIRQLRRFIDSAFERMRHQKDDALAARAAEGKLINEYLQQWEQALPPRSGRNNADWSEYFGMKGAVAKHKAEFETDRDTQARLWGRAAQSYLDALKAQVGNHWVAVQYLSIARVLDQQAESGIFELAERAAAFDLTGGGQGERRWAVGSLLELALLSAGDKALDKECVEWAEELSRLVAPEDFELFSTRRQLERYTQGMFADRTSAEVKERAAACLRTLPEDMWRAG